MADFVERFEEEQGFDDFIDDPENKYLLQRIAAAFPERADWQVTVDYLVNQVRARNDPQEPFRTLSLRIASWLLNVPNAYDASVSDLRVWFLKGNWPRCYCTTERSKENIQDPSILILKLLAQGMAELPSGRAKQIAIAGHFAQLFEESQSVVVYQKLYELSGYMDEIGYALETGNPKIADAAGSNLNQARQLLEHTLRSELANSFFGSDMYFSSLDIVAQTYVYDCALGKGTAAVDEVYRSYEKFIRDRERFVFQDNSNIYWIYEPEKYILYAHVEHFNEAFITNGTDETIELFEKMCPGYFDSIMNRLSDRFENFVSVRNYRDNWKKGTSADLVVGRAEQYLLNQARSINWRY